LNRTDREYNDFEIRKGVTSMRRCWSGWSKREVAISYGKRSSSDDNFCRS